MKSYRNYHGYFTALITPFNDDGSIDFAAFKNIIKRQVEANIHGIVVCGSTGEAGSLTEQEKLELLTVARKLYDGILVFGASAHNHDQVIDLTSKAAKVVADAVLISPPAYVKPSQVAIIEHYRKIHDNTNLPIILYNIPGRTAVDIADDTVVELSTMDRVIGIKDATADLNRPASLLIKLKEKHGDDYNFSLFSGDDMTTPAFLAQGGHGAISVTSNLLPKECVIMVDSWLNMDSDSGYLDGGLLSPFKKNRDFLAPVHPALFVESNPVPVKYALSKLGLCKAHVRPPLCELQPSSKAVIDDIMKKANIG